MKAFSKKVIHLNVNKIYDSLDNIRLNDNKLLEFIYLFENIWRLSVVFMNWISFELLFERMAFPFKYIMTNNMMYDIQTIPENLFKNRDLRQLQSLIIYRYVISKKTIESIINSLNLKRFDLTFNEVTSNLIEQMARRQKRLQKLSICWSLKKLIIFVSIVRNSVRFTSNKS